MTLIKIFLPIIIGGTLFLTLLMLPSYFIRKKKKPDDEKNTIIRLLVLSFLTATIFTLLFGSGLIMMYLDDLRR